jgi:Icc-related predicted phosphoesterase
VTGTIQDKIGSTVAVNPGQTRNVFSYATIRLDAENRQVLDVQHGQLA